ncbi:MAG: hypothetical protein WB987_13105 [Candidatus Acidiferrales bacterium]
MKKPWIAFLLNFLLAGAGFAYLGKWAWAAINLFGAIAAGFIIVRYAPNSLSMASTIIAALSGSLAMSTAKTMNARLEQQPAAPQHP